MISETKTGRRGRLRGYARVSTEEQGTDSQLGELRAAGCQAIEQEYASGVKENRPVLAKLLKDIQEGDTLVVVRIDRLARSVSHLLRVIDQLEQKGAHFRSLRDPIDTGSPQGVFQLQILGAVAQLERALISERTKAGIAAARVKGRIGGNPGLRARDANAISVVASARRKGHMDRVLAELDSWLPTVRQLRPRRSWNYVIRALNSTGEVQWTTEKLRRRVKRLAAEGIVEKSLLGRSPPRISNASEHLTVLVAGIAAAGPDLTLQEIASQLESMHERSPNGSPRWNTSSVRNLLRRGARRGLNRLMISEQKH
jgi:DNA invertase Pin-like site-specific DNA recombinase